VWFGKNIKEKKMEEQQIKSLHYGDELSVLDLLKILWQQKKLVLGSIVLGCLVSSSYLFLSPPIYEAKIIITAPTTGDISQLNVGRSYSQYSPIKAFNYSEVYRLYSVTLLSNATKQLFFRQIYLPTLQKKANKINENKLYNSYLKNIIVKTDFLSNPIKYTILARNEDPLVATKLVRLYVSVAKKESMEKLLGHINNQNKAYAEELQRKINGIQNALVHNQEEQINKVKNIIRIAKSAGIQNPIFTSNNLDDLGPKLRQLEYDYNYYKNMSISTDSIKMFRTDGRIMIPQTPAFPNNYLVMAVGLLAGLILGSLIGISRGLSFKKILN
jgi:chain length determinant protein (polysaccharide antigen chain regulator)